MTYDYLANGAEDFKGGRKDERLYAEPGEHGKLYRQGWQTARRLAQASRDGLGLASDLAVVVSSPYPPKSPPKGEECPFAPAPAKPVLTKESVKLATGEETPPKPEPTDPNQLGLF